jgi:hypothetical protein
MASFLPVLQMSGSIPCFAADPGAQAYNSGLRSTQERLKIEQQFWTHTRAATSSQLALHTKPNGIHQTGVLWSSLSLSLSPPPSCLLPSASSWWREQREVKHRTRNVCPHGFSLQALSDLGVAITPSLGEFLEKSRQAQHTDTFAQVHFGPKLSLASKGSNSIS